MVVKVYISGISGNKEVKKRQQRVLMILDSKTIKYDVIDITEPGKEADKDFMQNNAKSNGGTVSDPNPRSALPPQIFNDEEYCGDYDQFDLANEVDTLEQFLKLEVPPEEPPQQETAQEKVVNGDAFKEDNIEVNEKSEAKESSDEVKKEEINAEESATKDKTPSREATPADRVASKEPSPARDSEKVSENKDEVVKASTPERQKSVEKTITEPSPAKEKSPSPAKEKSPSPAKEKSPSPAKEKSPSPAKEKSPSPAKEKSPSPAKEKSPSPEKEKSPSPTKDDEVEIKHSKEPTPVRDDESALSEKEESINENGTASSREQSEEKKIVNSKKDNPSESLIASEQEAAAE